MLGEIEAVGTTKLLGVQAKALTSSHERIQAAKDLLNCLGCQYVIDKITGCWNYNGKAPTGQSKRCTIIMGNKGTTAGRVICTVVNGPPPSNLEYHAGHSCHNRDCINPEHFRWELYEDNQVKNTTGLPKGIRFRKNMYEAHIKRNGKYYYKSFSTIELAVQWLETIRCS
jgi:hypothetical protein